MSSSSSFDWDAEEDGVDDREALFSRSLSSLEVESCGFGGSGFSAGVGSGVMSVNRADLLCDCAAPFSSVGITVGGVIVLINDPLVPCLDPLFSFSSFLLHSNPIDGCKSINTYILFVAFIRSS